MAIHTIRMPDRVRGRELRSIIWDDEAGTVEGDHYEVEDIRRVFDSPTPVTFGNPGIHWWVLRDPAHDPAEFLAILGQFYWPILDEPLRSTLPAVFDGIDPVSAEPGEILYDANGNVRA